MTLRQVCFALLLLAGTASQSFAQGRANFAWWNSPVRADLNLTDEQSAKVREIVRSYRSRLLDARNNVQKADGDLEDLLNDEHIDINASKPLIERMATARANSSRVFTQMSLELRAILTLDQWRILVRKYAEIQRNKPADTQVTP
jgi:Spy/CpxP family protein refolding chaperone